MVRNPSRRLRYGALATAVALAGGAYYRRRSRTDRTPAPETIITERHATAFLAERRLDPDRVDELRTHVSKTLAEADSNELLGVDGASTATLFLDRSGEPPRSAGTSRSRGPSSTRGSIPKRRSTKRFRSSATPSNRSTSRSIGNSSSTR